jgi:hypothetical protein
MDIVYPKYQSVAVWAKAYIIFDFSAIPDRKIGAVELDLTYLKYVQ